MVASSSYRTYYHVRTYIVSGFLVLLCMASLLAFHFLPPGVAYTTGLSHNPFTWRPL